jgi:hypothetical protein
LRSPCQSVAPSTFSSLCSRPPPFGWCKIANTPAPSASRSADFQPEAAGRAVHSLAHHAKRREFVVGFATSEVVANSELLDIFSKGRDTICSSSTVGAIPKPRTISRSQIRETAASTALSNDRAIDWSQFTRLVERRAWAFLTGSAIAGIVIRMRRTS